MPVKPFSNTIKNNGLAKRGETVGAKKGRIENLTPFKKGNKMGAKGRPKGSVNLTTTLRKLLEQKLTLADKNGIKKTMTGREWVAESLMKKAIGKADVAAIREVFDRVDGKAAQTLDIGNKEGESFKTTLELDKETIKKMAMIVAYDDD